MIVNAGYRGKVGVKAPKFTYTGQYNIRKDGVVELLTSGTIVFLEPKVIDVFMVGGGGSGVTPSYSQNSNTYGYAGGGGGKTVTVRRVNVGTDAINVTIGEGGVAPASGGGRSNGKKTTFGTYSADGSTYPAGISSFTRQKGGNGGSGGGGGVSAYSNYGTGGSDGADGERGSSANTGGVGQGTTTREFGEPGGKLYAGGGGGGRYLVSSTPVISPGGSGGGGAGAWSTNQKALGSKAAENGAANTGGGGGGGVFDKTSTGILPGGSGGSGIVCFRTAK